MHERDTADDNGKRERGALLRRLHRDREMAWGADPKDYDPSAVESTLRRAGRFFGPRRYFRLDVTGLDQLPPPPVMIVSNHSGGMIVLDVWGFAVAWHRRFGTSRPLHVLCHEIILSTEVIGRYFARRGALRASRETARAAFALGRDVMVMPGGDLDTWRLHSRRYEVEFAGRTGYASAALDAGVPIVPVANAGPHDTLWVLSEGRALARAVGLPRLVRAGMWPIHLSLPWGVTIGPWPHLPLPMRFRYRVGPPIRPEGTVQQLDARVRAAMQVELDVLRRTEK